MPKTLVTPERNCGYWDDEKPPHPLPSTWIGVEARREYCSSSCRYKAWRRKKEVELHDLIKQLAGRIAV